jgi:hypothetical protein
MTTWDRAIAATAPPATTDVFRRKVQFEKVAREESAPTAPPTDFSGAV